jgi:predicted nucleic acid-binding Zn ribbon protein
VTEVRHGFKETHTDPCPSCGGPLARVFNPAGIVFKGSGFYINDSRKSSGGESSAPAASADSSASTTPSTPAAATPAPSGDSKKSESAA